MSKLKLKDLSLSGRRVLLRVDCNVPLHDDGSVSDDTRIRAALPTLRYILDHGASCVLMSHLGRPQGKRDSKASLAPVAKKLSALLGKNVPLAPDCVGVEVEELCKHLKPGQALFLENVRFHPGEEEPDKEPQFTESLASLGDLYVNDAFGTAHRAHASTALIARFFPHKAAMGFLIEKELEFLSPLLHSPVKPFYMILGGAKISSKAGVVKKLLGKLDALFIGGAMAFPFLKAKGLSAGLSLCPEQEVPVAKEILEEAKKHSLPLYLPVDFMAIRDMEISSFAKEIPEGWVGMDIGAETIGVWKEALKRASTLFWNGPLGVFEKPPFDKGTKAIAEALADLKSNVIVGGGDSVAAIQQMGLSDRFAHLSTGGGASLEYLEFGHLPGIDALSDK